MIKEISMTLFATMINEYSLTQPKKLVQIIYQQKCQFKTTLGVWIVVYTLRGQHRVSFPFCHQTILLSLKSGAGIFSLGYHFAPSPQHYHLFLLLTSLQTCPLLPLCVLVLAPIFGLLPSGLPPIPTTQTTQVQHIIVFYTVTPYQMIVPINLL